MSMQVWRNSATLQGKLIVTHEVKWFEETKKKYIYKFWKFSIFNFFFQNHLKEARGPTAEQRESAWGQKGQAWGQKGPAWEQKGPAWGQKGPAWGQKGPP